MGSTFEAFGSVRRGFGRAKGFEGEEGTESSVQRCVAAIVQELITKFGDFFFRDPDRRRAGHSNYARSRQAGVAEETSNVDEVAIGEHFASVAAEDTVSPPPTKILATPRRSFLFH